MLFGERLQIACASSGKYNRFMSLRACTALDMLAPYRDNPIFKIQKCVAEIGSSYKTRMSNAQGEPYQIKRDSYYDNVTDNGVLVQLKRDPNKKYLQVWKSDIRGYETVYIDKDGHILSDYETQVAPYVRKHKPYGESKIRQFHLENIFELKINGEEFKSDDFELYDAYLR